jgi:hypothetical protein
VRSTARREQTTSSFSSAELVGGEAFATGSQGDGNALDEALAIAKDRSPRRSKPGMKGIIHRDLKPAVIALTRNVGQNS